MGSNMNLFEERPIVYTAQSRHLFYAKMLVCKYVLEHGAVPLNPFNVWGYFLYELVERDLVRRGNNNIVRMADETWVFGPIADGVLAEIELVMKLNKPIRFYSAGSKYEEIHPIQVQDLTFEDNVSSRSDFSEIKQRIAAYAYIQSEV